MCALCVQEFGFSPADFLYVVERSPGVLLSRVDANLRPKLAFFRARGLSPPQLVAMVKAYPSLLAKNLHSALQPKVRRVRRALAVLPCWLSGWTALCKKDENLSGGHSRRGLLAPRR